MSDERRDDAWHGRTAALLVGCGLVVVAGAVGVALLGDLRRQDVARRVWAYVAVFGVQFAAYVGALIALRRVARAAKREGRLLAAGLGLAVAGRLVLVVFLPAAGSNLSNDVYRYVWEGFAQRQGVNPYLTKPVDAPAAVRNSPAGRAVTHPHVAAIYPPMTEQVFWLIDGVRGTPRGYRVAFLVFDLGTIVVLAALLRAMGRSRLWALAYAWHPLTMSEFAGSGHFDSLGLFWMVAAVYLLQRRQGLWAYAALGASIATKYFAAPLVLFFWPRTRKWHAVAAVLVFAILFWPYLPGGLVGAAEDGAALIAGRPPPHGTGRVFDGLRYFTGVYFSNAGLHRAVQWVLGETMEHAPVTRVAMPLIGVALLVGLYIGRARLVTAGLYAMGAVIVLNQVIHPWYATWIVPWLALALGSARPGDRWGLAAWLWFTGAVVISYVVLIEYTRTEHLPRPYWQVPGWSMWVQFAPLIVLLAVDAASRLRRRLVAGPARPDRHAASQTPTPPRGPGNGGT